MVDRHPFVRRPHRTLVTLSIPVLVSLVAEPLTGLADTAFVARLGAAPLAALGVATALLSSVFWAFNFLGIGTQTEVAHAQGQGSVERSADASGLAMAVGAALGVLLIAIGLAGAEPSARFMSPDPAVQDAAVVYLEIRLLGGPALLVMLAAFGALRGLQDMRTPLWIALGQNAINVALDIVLIFGAGPIPAFGIAGAAWASVASQWLGAFAAVAAVKARLGLPKHLHWREAGRLLAVGRDLFLRTGTLLLFILLCTRQATHLGTDSGAAHQVVRQFWTLSAFILDAFGAAAQSLVGYFLGAGAVRHARRAAQVACGWGLGAGFGLALAMVVSEGVVARGFVPAGARELFGAAWLACAFAQPANALAFATDGIHWGTGDYRFLRNAMLASTAVGCAALVILSGWADLAGVWIVTGAWMAVRAGFGVARIWPGLGTAAPLAASR